MSKFYESRFLLPLFSFLITALLMTVYEATKYRIFGRLSLWESHVMTIVFTSMIAALLSGLIARKLKSYYDNTRTAQARLEIYEAAMRATSHYVGNMLNMAQLIEIEFNNSGTINHDSVRELGAMLRLTELNVQGLCSLENPTKENVEQYVKANL
ncbi:MAG: hypothetical protein HYZ46_04660 [Nitrosomonadales bacterium]|nr:hypothetical protein [Nitrosomonadales bacterium]